ncbi:hypothetical protein SARC_01157 [Sphaeroforma arctica JP610]|uniref:Uncharacterized protein n=1 Tax=Sphaeroforma arctica JP610 TaxID=667725 RepID=A0A0L0GCQ5_9EUKA|nr:hypothetical protein SARC_01157 [Sphaeroforma arctica JP610]KNC86689.1 hypothetical protein SARC_01157 [Sphaeroforma arctica JP610]|eukprot:XP_014160591.1 hypothetical protein SARC_01157 [Sphaeroforma arctica JP610]
MCINTMFTIEPIRGVEDASFADNTLKIHTNGSGIVRLRLTRKGESSEPTTESFRVILQSWSENCEGLRFVSHGATSDEELGLCKQTYNADTKVMDLTLTQAASRIVMIGGELIAIDFYR